MPSGDFLTGDVLVNEDKIEQVAPTIAQFDSTIPIIDAQGLILLPQCLFRNVAIPKSV